MNNQIDERVVEMQFDNSNFEKNVSKSMSTIEKLKKALNFKSAEKSLNELEKSTSNVKMEPLTNAISVVTSKFSALDVVAFTALQRITNSAITAGKNLVKSLSVDQISAGWTKFAQKTESVQTIMNATGKSIDDVNGYLDQLMWFSDETSYGFTDMTSSLAQLTSAGGDIDKLIPMIMGVANATAYAGKGAAEFSRAIYNLNQSYSSGALKYMDWKSLEMAGVASKELKQVFIDTALAAGKITEGQVTIANFGQTLSNNWADTEVMEKAFGRFSAITDIVQNMVDVEGYDTARAAISDLEKSYLEAADAAEKMVEAGDYETVDEALKSMNLDYDYLAIKAFKAAQECKTFNEVIDATKDAVSTGWLRTFENIFGNYEEAKVLWSGMADSLWEIFASGGESRNTMLAEAFGSTWSGITTQIENAGGSSETFERQLTSVLEKHGFKVDELVEKYGSLGAIFESPERHIPTKYLQEAFQELSESGKVNIETIGEATKNFETYRDLIKDIYSGKYGIGKNLRWSEITDQGFDYKQVKTLADMVLHTKGYELTLEQAQSVITDMSAAQTENIELTDEEREAYKQLAEAAGDTEAPLNGLIDRLKKPTGRDLLFGSITNILTAISNFKYAISDVWSEVFGDGAGPLYSFLKGLNGISEKILSASENCENLSRTFRGLFSILKLISNIVKGAFRISFKIIGSIFDGFGDNLSDIAGSIGDALTNFEQFISKNEYITKAFDVIGTVLETAINTIAKAFDILIKVVKAVKEKIVDFVTVIVSKVKETEIYKQISEMIKTSSDKIETAIDNLQKKFGNLNFENVTITLEKFLSFMSGLFDTIKKSDQFISFTSKLTEFFNKLKTLKFPEIDFKNLTTKLSDFLDFCKNNDLGIASGFIQKIKTSLTLKIKSLNDKVLLKFSEFYLKYGDKIRSGMEKFRNIAKGIAEFIFGPLDELNLEKIAGMVKTFLEIKILLKTLSIINNLTGALDSISEGLSNLAKAAKWKAIAEAFKAIALALAIFIGGIALLLYFKDFKSVTKAAGLMLGMIVVLGAVVGVLVALAGKIGDAGKVWTIVAMLLSISLSVLILAETLIKIDKYDFKHLGRSFFTLSGVLLILVASIKMVDKMMGAGSIKSVAAILTLLAAVELIPEILEKYSEFPWEKYERSILILGAVLFTLAAVTRSATRGIKAGANTSGLSGIILSMVLSLLLIYKIISKFGEMDEATLKQGAFAVSAIMAVITGMIVAINKTSKIETTDRDKKQLNNFKGLAIALLACVGAIYLLGKMPIDILKQGGYAFIVLIGLIDSVLLSMKGSNFAGAKTGAILITFIGFALILAEIAIIIKRMSDIPWQNAMSAAGSVALVILAMSYCLKMVSGISITFKKASLGLLALGLMGAIIFEISEIIKLMTFDSNGIIKKVLAISILLGAMTGSLAVIAAFAAGGLNLAGMMTGVLTLACMGLVVAEIAAILKFITFDPNGALIKVGALSGLLLAMTLCVAIVSAISAGGLNLAGMMSGVLALACVGLVVAEIAAILKFITFDPNGALIKVGAISALLVVMAAITAVCAVIGYGASTAVPGALALIKVTGLIGLALVAIGELVDKFDGIGPSIDRAIPIMESIGTAIGTFVGSIIGSLVGSVAGKSSGGIEEFSNMINSLSESLGNVDTDVLTNCKDAAVAINDLLSNLPKSVKMDDSNWEEIGGKLNSFGTMISSFSESLGDNINTPAIQASADAVSAIATLLDIVPKTGGIASSILGDPDISKLGTGLPTFGRGLKSYSISVTGLDSQAILDSVSAAKGLTEVVKSMPRTGGIAQTYLGDKDASVFGERLVEFGKDLVKYADSVKDLNTEAIELSAGSASALTEVVNSMPRAGGTLQTWIGDKNASVFGERLVQFGRDLLAYSNIVSKLNTESIDGSIKPTQDLTNLVNSMPEMNGIKQKLLGENDAQEFGIRLEALGTSMVNFGQTVENINDKAIAKASTTLDDIIDVINRMPSNEGIQATIFGSSDLTIFSNGLSNLAFSLGYYSDQLSGIDFGLINKSASSITTMSNALKHVTDQGELNVNSFITSGIKLNEFDFSGISKIALYLSSLSDSAIDISAVNTEKINAFITMIQSIGSISIQEGAAEQITSYLSGVVQSFTNYGAELSEAAASISGGFAETLEIGLTSSLTNVLTIMSDNSKLMGTESIISFSSGISENISSASDTFTSLMNECIAVITLYSGEKGIMWTNGNYIGENYLEGVIYGLNSIRYQVYETVEDIASAMLYTMKVALDINSPSGKAAEIAEYFDKGLVVGVNKNKKEVTNSIESLANDAINSFKTIMPRIDEVAKSKMTIKPSIVPVFDSSGFSTTNYELQTSIDPYLSRPINSLSNIIAEAQNGINDSNREVVSAIMDLRNDLSGYYSNDEKEISLYVDSRKLATSLANPMNRQLNILSKRGSY